MLEKRFVVFLFCICLVLSGCSLASNYRYVDDTNYNETISGNSFIQNKNEAYILRTSDSAYVTILKNNTYMFERGDRTALLDFSIDNSNYVYVETDTATVTIGYMSREDKEAAYMNELALLHSGFSSSNSEYGLSNEDVKKELTDLSQRFPNETIIGRDFISKEGNVNSTCVLTSEIVKDVDGSTYKIYSDFLSTVVELTTGECLVISVNLKQEYVEDLLCKLGSSSSLKTESEESYKLVNSCKVIIDDVSQYILIGDYSDEYAVIDLPSASTDYFTNSESLSDFNKKVKLDCGCEVLLEFDSNCYYVNHNIEADKRCKVKHMIELEDTREPSNLFDSTTKTYYALDWSNFVKGSISDTAPSLDTVKSNESEITSLDNKEEAVEVFYSN